MAKVRRASGHGQSAASALTRQTAAPHGAPQVVTRAHQVDELPLPFVLDRYTGALAGLSRDVGARRRQVRPLTVLPHEDDARAAPADVLNDRRGASVPCRERLQS